MSYDAGDATRFGLVRVFATGVISYGPALWTSLISGDKLLALHGTVRNYNYIVYGQVDMSYFFLCGPDITLAAELQYKGIHYGLLVLEPGLELAKILLAP